MKKYLFIVITFVAMHLSSIVGVPIIYLIGALWFDIEQKRLEMLSMGIWTVFSFILATVIVLLLLKNSEPYTKIDKAEPMPVGPSILWAIGGIFLAMFSQIVGALIEIALGIDPGSENTQFIMELIENMSLVILVSSILGPFLEEIVFRKIIFGLFYNRFSFWISALLSSVVFSIAHLDFSHIILYTAMGFTFAFLYVKTKRIIVPIISHMAMNTIVAINLLFWNPEQPTSMPGLIHSWIGGILP